jgi:DNA anti-recombination protein RmuC
MSISTEINEKLLQQVYSIYAESEQKMLEKVAKRVKRGINEVGWNEEKLADVQSLKKEIGKLMKDTNAVAKSKVSRGIVDAYLKGVNSAN